MFRLSVTQEIIGSSDQKGSDIVVRLVDCTANKQILQIV